MNCYTFQKRNQPLFYKILAIIYCIFGLLSVLELRTYLAIFKNIYCNAWKVTLPN